MDLGYVSHVENVVDLEAVSPAVVEAAEAEVIAAKVAEVVEDAQVQV